MKTFDEYQERAGALAIFPNDQSLTYTALGLCGEAGEYAEKVKKWIRDGKLDTDGALLELGDVLWYLSQCARVLGTNLSEVARNNLLKLESRRDRGALQGSGDER